MIDFTHLKKNLKRDYSGLKKIKVALLGDTATQFLVQAIKGMGFERGLNLEIWEADFNQIDRQTLDPSSDLYRFEPEIVILFQATHKLLAKFYQSQANEQQHFAEYNQSKLDEYIAHINQSLKAKIILYNYNEIDDTIFGNFANSVSSSFLYQLRKLNVDLMDLATRFPNLFICDLSSIQNRIGRNKIFQPSIYINTEMVLSIDALPEIASRTLDIIAALQGSIKKCLILDLDNTLWGGVIGDDGIENIQIGSLGIGKTFSEFQHWIKALKKRGIILAICSKNTESVAKEPFEKHPDMVLRLDDIAVFMANWDNKVQNIQQIREILNIGLDAMVFLDDNIFERNMVREHLPEVCVPELPEDPADYLEFLYAQNLFETVSLSEEDRTRTTLYQTEMQRVSQKQKFTNEADFLKSLAMKSVVEGFTKYNIPRVAQLTQRSNQFNLRTIRYTETDIAQLAVDENYIPLTFTLEDKFGNNGLICLAILEKKDAGKLFIDTWLMSCRVLKRGMEHFVLNKIVEVAIEKGFSVLQGEYLPTTKNMLVKDHFEHLGFTFTDGYWMLNTNEYQPKLTYIIEKQE